MLASARGSLARLELPFSLSFPYTLTVEGSPLQPSLEVLLQGTIVLEGGVGCPTDCGAHGRCWAAGASAGNGSEPGAAGAQPACECECGWEGAGLLHGVLLC